MHSDATAAARGALELLPTSSSRGGVSKGCGRGHCVGGRACVTMVRTKVREKEAKASLQPVAMPRHAALREMPKQQSG